MPNTPPAAIELKRARYTFMTNEQLAGEISALETTLSMLQPEVVPGHRAARAGCFIAIEAAHAELKRRP